MEEDDDDISMDFGSIFKKKKPQIEQNNSKNKDELQEMFGDDDKQAKKSFHQPKIEKKEEIIIPKMIPQKKQTENKASSNKEEFSDDETDDEDISFDFSKIKKIFQSDKKPSKKELTEENDEDLSIDFSGIKKIFQSEKKTHSSDEEDISVDWKSIATSSQKFIVPALILIAILVTFLFRIQPAYLPATDGWAQNSVNNYFTNQIQSQIDRQYPNLPDANRKSLADSEFIKFQKENKEMLNQQKKATSDYFKSQLQYDIYDDKGNVVAHQTYLIALDPYFWARHARNIINNGHPGDILVDQKPFDNHMLAPNGRFVPGDMFHAYLEAWVYKFFHLFNKNLDIVQVAFYFPVILSILAIFPVFFLTRKIGGNIGGFFAALMIAIHPVFLTRTGAGYADTDVYNIVFPLFIIWTLFEALESRKIIFKVSLTILSSLLVMVYSKTWGGWWFILDLAMGTIGIYILYLMIIAIKDKKNILHDKSIIRIVLTVIFFFLTSAVLVSLLSGFDFFKSAVLSAPGGFSSIKEVAKSSIWPNVFTTVAEQNASSFSSVIDQMGGKILLLIVILGIIMAFFIKDSEGKYDIKYIVLLILWFLSTFYASVKGVRFSLLLVPVYCLAFGIFVGIGFNKISKNISKLFSVNITLTKIVVLVMMCLILVQPLRGALNIAKTQSPTDLNDGWYNALEKIKNNSSKNAIITSWWDFGHWFKYIADRPVTFDGTSQDSPQAHWVGKILLSDNEDQAVGILKMLVCGGNTAFDKLNLIIGDEYRTITILYEIFEKDNIGAKKVFMSNGLSSAQAEEILDYTHCDPPENYFIVSDDMIPKSGVWAHFGSWDFNRSSMYYHINGLDNIQGIKALEEQFGLSSEDSQNTYYEIKTQDTNNWIAPWPSYVQGLISCTEQSGVIKCTNGITINKTNYEAYIPNQNKAALHPKIFAYPLNDSINKANYDEPLMKTGDGKPLGVILIPKGSGSYSISLCSPELASSMFTRLYFMEGQGLKHFDLFTHESLFTGGQVYVWKVNWKGNDKPNIMNVLKPKFIANTGDKITVDYIGYLGNGTVFDSSIIDWQTKKVKKNSKLEDFKLRGFSFEIGKNQVIPGFEDGFLGMNLSETKIIEVAPEKGYGTDPALHPLGNKTLFFKVKIQKIE